MDTHFIKRCINGYLWFYHRLKVVKDLSALLSTSNPNWHQKNKTTSQLIHIPNVHKNLDIKDKHLKQKKLRPGQHGADLSSLMTSWGTLCCPSPSPLSHKCLDTCRLWEVSAAATAPSMTLQSEALRTAIVRKETSQVSLLLLMNVIWTIIELPWCCGHVSLTVW